MAWPQGARTQPGSPPGGAPSNLPHKSWNKKDRKQGHIVELEQRGSHGCFLAEEHLASVSALETLVNGENGLEQEAEGKAGEREDREGRQTAAPMSHIIPGAVRHCRDGS